MRGVGAYCGQDPGSLLPTHHTDACIGPHEQKVGTVSSATHAVVAGAKAPTYQYGQLWHLPQHIQLLERRFRLVLFPSPGRLPVDIQRLNK